MAMPTRHNYVVLTKIVDGLSIHWAACDCGCKGRGLDTFSRAEAEEEARYYQREDTRQ